MHKLWLGQIYPWAGCYRQVNLSKNGFPFAGARQIPKLMEKFESHELKIYTPCHFTSFEKIIEAIAITHSEFILIHPFREGNGRAGRLLASLMSLQANLPMLDFKSITGAGRKDYFLAIQAAVEHDYTPIQKIFKKVIETTVSAYEKKQ